MIRSMTWLNAQLLSQSQLESIHLTVISFMVVATKVKQAVKNELGNFSFKRQTVFFRLRRGGID